MRALLLTSLLIGSLAGYGPPDIRAPRYVLQTKTEHRLTPADEDDIREAVFRYQFAHNASAQQQKTKVYFLSLDKDKDPSDAFMLRFEDHKPPVRKRSRAGASQAIDKQTGERGLIFYVGSIKPLSEDEVKVDGGYYEDGLSASGNTYTVRREKNKWVVKGDQMRWIS